MVHVLAPAFTCAYEPGPLEACVEDIDESSAPWRKQTVSYLTAYDGVRMNALLFLPRNAEPPYQTVVWFPGNDVYAWRSSDSLASEWLFDFIAHRPGPLTLTF